MCLCERCEPTLDAYFTADILCIVLKNRVRGVLLNLLFSEDQHWADIDNCPTRDILRREDSSPYNMLLNEVSADSDKDCVRDREG